MADLYKSVSWLRRKYLVEKKTAEQIADECGVSTQTIFLHLKKHGLMKNPRTWKRKS